MPRGLRFMEWIQRRRAAHRASRGVRRLLLAAWKAARRLPFAGRVCVRMAVDGHRMRVRCFSYDDLLIVSPGYEAPIAGVLPPPGGVAVDAGAFIGLYTLRYARAVGPEGRVVAVEPHRRNFRLLAANVRLNGYANVTCVPCALGREPGEVWLAHDEETSTASTVRDRRYRQRAEQAPLDDLMDRLEIGEIALLKIDVEGAELAVLEGGSRILGASPDARLVIEVHARPEPMPGAPCPVRQWLAARGYAVEEVHDGPRRFYVAQRPRG